MFTKILKISFFLTLFLISSCGIKKSWEESGKYTSDKSVQSTYIWKKGKQYIAIVQAIPVRGRNKKIQFTRLIFLKIQFLIHLEKLITESLKKMEKKVIYAQFFQKEILNY